MTSELSPEDLVKRIAKGGSVDDEIAKIDAVMDAFRASRKEHKTTSNGHIGVMVARLLRDLLLNCDTGDMQRALLAGIVKYAVKGTAVGSEMHQTEKALGDVVREIVSAIKSAAETEEVPKEKLN